MKFLNRKDSHFDYTTERKCLNCKALFIGKYCSMCGEKVVEADDRSFKHFLTNVFNAFTFIDGNFYRSLRQIILHPGVMSRDIVIGIRQRYMKPVAFFFVANFIYFIFPIFETFNTTLYAQMELQSYSGLCRTMVSEHLVSTGQTQDSFAVIYNQASTNWSKLLLIVLVALIFPFLTLINYSRRYYLSDHLMYSLEYCSYLLFVPTILFGFLLKATILIGRLMNQDLTFIFKESYTVPFILISLLYFFIRGARTFYQYKWWRVILNSMLSLVSMVIVLNAYRLLLFLVTMHSLSK